MQMRGKVWVVTGAGGGMGRELTLLMLSKGARVAAVDVSAGGLEETARLAAAGDRLSTHVVDITDHAAVEALPAAVVAAHGAVDGLLNNAGVIQPFLPVAELDDAAIRRVLDVNLMGTAAHVAGLPPAARRAAGGAPRERVEHGRLLPVPGPDDVRRQQGRGEALHRGAVRRADRHPRSGSR